MSDAMTYTAPQRSPIEHELKTWQSYFHAIADGSKNFEIRRDNRGFRIGDTLWLRETEYGSGKYTGREARRKISYILRHASDFGLADGFAILSLEPLEAAATIARLEAELFSYQKLHFECGQRLLNEAAQNTRLEAELSERKENEGVWGKRCARLVTEKARLEAEIARYKEDYGIILQASRDNDDLIKELLAENAGYRELLDRCIVHILAWSMVASLADSSRLVHDIRAALAPAQPGTGGD